MSDEPDRFRQIVYGVAAAATVTFGTWAGAEIISINIALAKIETAMVENRHERQLQVEHLKHRIERLEAYREREK